jgi:two-component system, chemotaxis family, chemotaxis protein CheY
MKVLVVDDSSTMRRIIANTLKQLGQETLVEAGDGLEALAQLQNEAGIELILTDWNMPNMNGLDFLKKAKASPAHASIPVVMVTTEAEKGNVILALKSGAKNYIVKPFTAEVLREKLKSVLV